MPEERERPRPHGDPLENAVHENAEQNRAQSQSDATPEEIPGGRDRDFRELSDRARDRGSTANGVPEFDEDAGSQRKRQYDGGAEIVSGTD
jgi:hypothetical protein